MEPIRKGEKKISWQLKLSMGLFCLAGAAAFFWASRERGAPPVELITDQSIAPPECAVSSGFYEDVLLTELSGPSGRIYYTLDGTTPSLTSEQYNGPFLVTDRTDLQNIFSAIPTSPRWKPPAGNVFKGTVLRAIAVFGDHKKSRELIRTFFISEKGRSRYAFPVLSLVIEPRDLFGYKDGIYVMGKQYEDKDHYLKKDLPLDLPWWEYPSNYLKKGSDSDRDAYVELIEKDSLTGFHSAAKIRISGNATRGYGQKSMRLTFGEKGMNALEYPLFPGKESSSYSSFVLRNSGNDWDKTMFRDAFMRSLLDGFRLDLQEHRPCIVFINGEYWGIHDICERLDEMYVSHKYGISTDSIAMLESDHLFFGKKSDLKEFSRMLRFIREHDLSEDQNYEQLKGMMDIGSFTDFVIANSYYSNSDWPANNVKCWRYRNESTGDGPGVRDGKWRWMLYDLDWGFGGSDPNGFRLNLLEKAAKTGSIGVIFEGLLRNRQFRMDFEKRFQQCIAHHFEKQRVLDRISAFERLMEPEIREHIDRWRVIGDHDRWKRNVEDLRVFAEKRPAIQLRQLSEFLEKYK